MNRDSIGDIDHATFNPPFLRLVKETISSGCLHDFRIAQPNVSVIPSDVLHSFEHLLLYHFTDVLGINFSSVGIMGCQTGFYIVTSIEASKELDKTLKIVLNRILIADSVPWCNKHSCGRWLNHNLEGAKQLAEFVLSKYDSIDKVS